MKRTIIGGLMAAGLVFAGSGAASAGEYTGNGGSTPAGDRAQSLCAYSGQDISDELENNPPGLDDDELAIHGVQNYGQFVSQGLKGVIGDERPGVSCRGNAFGNPGQGHGNH